MSLHDSLRSSGWLIVFSLVGASILSSCGRIARPDFSTGTGGTPGDGDGDMGGKPGDGDGDTGGTTGDGDGDMGGKPGDGDGDSDTGGKFGDGDGDGDGDETAPSCADHTCQNGATCGPDGDDYTCECADGFSGPKCETNIDDCANSPCENGGACVDQVAGFRVRLPRGANRAYLRAAAFRTIAERDGAVRAERRWSGGDWLQGLPAAFVHRW